ncbi:hypothetical protein E4T39_03031 [Aureobasidium subglaciale]|nr:hypothetical protein E4T39_03031 [Aureobasidium subglaciale]
MVMSSLYYLSKWCGNSKYDWTDQQGAYKHKARYNRLHWRRFKDRCRGLRCSPVFFDRQHTLVHTEYSVPDDMLLLFIPVVKTNLMARQASGLGAHKDKRDRAVSHRQAALQNRRGRVNVRYQIPGPDESRLKITFPRPPSKSHCSSLIGSYKVAFKGCFGPCLSVQEIV